MATTTDKSFYVKIWQQINPLDDPFIRTQKTILWIQGLLKRQQLASKQPQSYKQGKGKDKKPTAEKYQKKSDRKTLKKNKTDSQTKQKPKPTQESANKQSSTQIDSSIKQQITQQVILSYIKKYSQTQQYKLLCKQQQKKAQPQPLMKQEKQKKSLSKQGSKKISKKTQPKQPETRYEQSFISLTYQQAIFFFYWFKKIYQKDSKQRFLQKVKKQQQHYQQQQLELQQNHSPQPLTKPPQPTYQPKHFLQLTQRQISYINQQSFLSLKPHQPKLNILFKHYAKLSHVLTKQLITFDQRTSVENTMTLHQWMVFCKDWNLLNAKNINQGWEPGKLTREFLVDVYYKNSLFRKQMAFDMFLRALIAVSCRMYQDCDIYKVKPIDLMLNFLTIKNQQKFIQNLQTKSISYRQGDILSCFKVKDRDVFEKMNIIRVTGSENFRKSRFSLLRQRRDGAAVVSKEGSIIDDNKIERNSERGLGKVSSQVNLQGNHQTTTLNILLLHPQPMDHNYSTGNLSKISSTMRKNRKSAPEIGIKLPHIQQNKFFTRIPQNNHLNKFKCYLENQIPESSSVLRNKITGYHKIHAIQSQEEGEKLEGRNRVEHLRMSKLIGSKMEGLVDGERERGVNPEDGERVK